MQLRKFALLILCAALLAAKKKKPEVTQVLDLPKDPPMLAAGDSSRLVFNVSPLSTKGLLSAQTRDALKAILKLNGGAPVIHLRAFVAGSGDLRRVPQLVSEVFGDKHLALPSVSVLQAGALPLEGAQIVIEAISEAKKSVTPAGLSFIDGQQDLAKLQNPLAVTCFVSDIAAAPALIARFPGAAVNVVQTQRIPSPMPATCEGVIRGGAAARLAFSGTQVAFGAEEKDAKLAFQRLDRDLADAHVISTNIYAVTPAAGELARKLRPGALTVIPVEGVASMEGSFAVDVIAVSSK